MRWDLFVCASLRAHGAAERSRRVADMARSEALGMFVPQEGIPLDANPAPRLFMETNRGGVEYSTTVLVCLDGAGEGAS